MGQVGLKRATYFQKGGILHFDKKNLRKDKMAKIFPLFFFF